MSGHGCFERHLREAIALNRERLPRYAALSGGRSIPVSRRLIRAERWLLPVARWMDWRARYWQRHGIPVGCAEFVSMDEAPAFPEHAPPAGPTPDFDLRGCRRRIHAAWRAGGFERTAQELDAALAALDRAPHAHCMLRHLLESARRVCTLAPRHAEDARRLGLRSPLRFSRSLLRLHLLGLGQAVALDRLAAPLQAEGIPIICQDVPRVPAS